MIVLVDHYDSFTHNLAQGLEEADFAGPDATGATGGRRHLQMHYTDGGASGNKELVVLLNLEQGDVGFRLPPGTWTVRGDTQAWFDLPGTSGEPTGWFDENPDADPFESHNVRLDTDEPVSGTYTVPQRTIVILEEA